jgi:GntR family transcriptional regulator
MTRDWEKWFGQLRDTTSPRYLALADEIERAVAVGVWKPGDRLPPQRLIADFLMLHVNTVNRAFRETGRRGITSGHRRRGTCIVARGDSSE